MTKLTPEATIRAALEAKPEGGDWYVDQDPRHGMSWNRQINAGPALTVCFMAHSDGKHRARDAATADFIAACSPTNITALLAELDAARQFGRAKIESLIAERDAARTRASEAARNAQRYEKWRALFLSESDNDSMLALMDAWTPEAVDKAIDAALTQSTSNGSDHV